MTKISRHVQQVLGYLAPSPFFLSGVRVMAKRHFSRQCFPNYSFTIGKQRPKADDGLARGNVHIWNLFSSSSPFSRSGVGDQGSRGRRFHPASIAVSVASFLGDSQLPGRAPSEIFWKNPLELTTIFLKYAFPGSERTRALCYLLCLVFSSDLTFLLSSLGAFQHSEPVFPT